MLRRGKMINNNLSESLAELRKLVVLMDEDAETLSVTDGIRDYIVLILDSVVEEIDKIGI